MTIAPVRLSGYPASCRPCTMCVVIGTGFTDRFLTADERRRINLGYRDPASIDVAAWTGREREGILVVPRAGEMLYRLKPR